MKLTHRSRLGIDIGRVLMCPAQADGRPDSSFLNSREEDALQVPATPYMFDVVPRLAERAQGAWLVSKAGPRIERLTLLWLERHDFYERTGVPRTNVRFCRERHEKRKHAAQLGLTHFIDDRVDVLDHLRGLVPNLILFGLQKRPAPKWVSHAGDWLDVAQLLLRKDDELWRHVGGEPDAVWSA